MKINDVLINNWQAPGAEWWIGVEARPDEPLIEATMKLTLSWREYHKMIEQAESSRVEAPNAKLSHGQNKP